METLTQRPMGASPGIQSHTGPVAPEGGAESSFLPPGPHPPLTAAEGPCWQGGDSGDIPLCSTGSHGTTVGQGGAEA